MTRTITIAFCLCVSSVAHAGVASKAVREAAETLFRKGGKEAAELGLETITRKLEALALKYGDDAIIAAQKVGPRTFRLVEEAGENGLAAVKLLARHGDEAVWVVAKKNRLAIFIKYGDDAADAMLKHGQIAEPLIESLGAPSTKALKAISTKNGRRLAMLEKDGSLTKIGRTDELLAVIGKHGDRAMDFVWKNKGALAVTASLAAFLYDPRPFIDGATDLANAAVEGIARPMASEMARQTNWTFLLAAAMLLATVVVALRMRQARRAAREVA
ncbi:MAG TPA: hypothetical protein VF278_06635 [Pirellulales bacterium]